MHLSGKRTSLVLTNTNHSLFIRNTLGFNFLGEVGINFPKLAVERLEEFQAIGYCEKTNENA